MKQAIFNLPVITGKLQQIASRKLIRRQTGDGVDHLPGAAIFHFAMPFNPADRCNARPILIQTRRQFGAHGDAARFNSAVTFFNRFRALQVRWITPLADLKRLGGNNRLRGECRRRRV